MQFLVQTHLIAPLASAVQSPYTLKLPLFYSRQPCALDACLATPDGVVHVRKLEPVIPRGLQAAFSCSLLALPNELDAINLGLVAWRLHCIAAEGEACSSCWWHAGWVAVYGSLLWTTKENMKQIDNFGILPAHGKLFEMA